MPKRIELEREEIKRKWENVKSESLSISLILSPFPHSLSIYSLFSHSLLIFSLPGCKQVLQPCHCVPPCATRCHCVKLFVTAYNCLSLCTTVYHYAPLFRHCASLCATARFCHPITGQITHPWGNGPPPFMSWETRMLENSQPRTLTFFFKEFMAAILI